MMWNTLGGYALQGAGALYQNYQNNKQAEENREFQSAMMDKANAFSLDMWNRENAYNHPLEQMKRLKEAGINPALAYANGVSNTAGGAPSSVAAPEGDRARMENPMSAFGNLGTDIAEAELSEKKADLTSKEVEKVGKEIILTEKMTLKLSQDIKASEQMIEESKARMQKIYDEVQVLRAKVNNLNQDTFLKWTQQEAQNFVNAFNKRVAGMRFQKEGHETNKAKFEAECSRLMALKIASDIALNGSVIEVNNSQIKINGQILRGLEFDNDINDKTKEQILDMVGVDALGKRFQFRLNQAIAGKYFDLDEKGMPTGELNSFGIFSEGMDQVSKLFSGSFGFFPVMNFGGGHRPVTGFGRR